MDLLQTRIGSYYILNMPFKQEPFKLLEQDVISDYQLPTSSAKALKKSTNYIRLVMLHTCEARLHIKH